ncbi:3-phosphoshikimate 1-carboxyvinyltransferase [Candidatus Fermentibacterales bacterium]|nr:3-phosphoshikimate 1-carboxyvinyltransferase [Candidatus Fermentibacterales bacterium]
MSTCALTSLRLRGAVEVPGDKSISHRVLLMSLLATGESVVHNLSPCVDVCSSAEAVRALGGEVSTLRGGALLVRGAAGRMPDCARVDCGNSGTTIRLLMGVLTGAPGSFMLDGDSSLRRRPMARVAEPLARMGASIDCINGCCPVSIRGCSPPRCLPEFATPVPSAQLKSAVLLAGAQAEGGSTTVVEQHESRDHTERLLEIFGAEVVRRGRRSCSVSRSDLRMPSGLRVPGDPSSAAFLLCAAAVLPDSEVSVPNALLSPSRTGFLRVLRRMGADVSVSLSGYYPEPHGAIRVRSGSRIGLRGCTVASREVPSMIDEIPVLALVASQARGRTLFKGLGELRVKESDRLGAICGQLGRMGASIHAEGDDLVVEGPCRLSPCAGLSSGSDHRIAMALSVASLLAGSEFRSIAGEQSVAVSYPRFAEALEALLEG